MGRRQNVDGRFVLHDVSTGEGQGKGKSRQVGFQVATYDVGLPLVIDPVLVYSTYLGGSNGDEGYDVAVDGNGNAYVIGVTSSTDFPIVNATYSPLQGGDIFISKLSSNGQIVHYSTYFGGSNGDTGMGITVDVEGNAYVTGFTYSTDFPTVNAKYPNLQSPGQADAFVFKLK